MVKMSQELINMDGYSGIRVIGDIHGMSGDLGIILDDADKCNLFPVLLGDMVDRGYDSPGVIVQVNELLRSGTGRTIVGNHDDKYYRYLKGSPVNIAHGLDCTIKQMEELEDECGDMYPDMFKYIMENSPLYFYSDFGGKRNFFVHGGFKPGMIDLAPYWYKDKKRNKGYCSLALYGSTNNEKTPEGFPVRLYDWIDDVPSGVRVFVGHDVVDYEKVVVKTNDQGGEVYFVDTGSGKGGILSFVDIMDSSIVLSNVMKLYGAMGPNE
jgi:hypothetical protein